MHKLKRTNTESEELNRFQFQVADAYDTIVDQPILNGQLIEGLQLSAGIKNVEHKLGRALRGWIVVRKTANQDVWEAIMQPAPSSILALQASGSVTVSLWVF